MRPLGDEGDACQSKKCAPQAAGSRRICVKCAPHSIPSRVSSPTRVRCAMAHLPEHLEPLNATPSGARLAQTRLLKPRPSWSHLGEVLLLVGAFASNAPHSAAPSRKSSPTRVRCAMAHLPEQLKPTPLMVAFVANAPTMGRASARCSY